MKKILLTVLALALATSAYAGIAGSSHDIPSWSSSTADNTEICVFCHTPHGAISTTGPLWNRSSTFSGFQTTAYTSSTLNASISMTYSDIDAAACMTCHDGTAMDSLGNSPNTATSVQDNTISGGALFDDDLSDDHPVNFNYDSVQAVDSEINLRTGLPSNFAFKSTNIMQCSTCHDVHNGGGADNLMVMNNAGSNLCLACHVK